MGTIRVHEFTSLDGVIDTPTWTLDFGFDPAIGHRSSVLNLKSSPISMSVRNSEPATSPVGVMILAPAEKRTLL